MICLVCSVDSFLYAIWAFLRIKWRYFGKAKCLNDFKILYYNRLKRPVFETMQYFAKKSLQAYSWSPVHTQLVGGLEPFCMKKSCAWKKQCCTSVIVSMHTEKYCTENKSFHQNQMALSNKTQCFTNEIKVLQFSIILLLWISLKKCHEIFIN